jgi:type IV secretion system protein VirB4
VTHARRMAVLHRERNAAEHIPYAAHVAESVVSTTSGDYLQAFRLGGASFESADDEQLNNWHERLNVLWRNLASPDLALWTHVIRRRERAAFAAQTHRPGFAQGLAVSYATRLAGETLMVNELYLALLFRPAAGLAAGLVSRALSRTRRRDQPLELAQALETCAKLAQTVCASLARYEPEALGVYRYGNTWCSTLLEYLAVLVNGESRRVPLPRGPLHGALATTRLLFGTEAIEYRMPAATRVGAMLGIKEYPTPSCVGMYNRLLSAPFSLVLTHSFTFLTKASAQALLQRQFYRMANAGDFALVRTMGFLRRVDRLVAPCEGFVYWMRGDTRREP